jgi:hypothetical protein
MLMTFSSKKQPTLSMFLSMLLLLLLLPPPADRFFYRPQKGPFIGRYYHDTRQRVTDCWILVYDLPALKQASTSRSLVTTQSLCG